MFANVGSNNEMMLYAFSCDEPALREIESHASANFGATAGGNLALVGGELHDRAKLQ